MQKQATMILKRKCNEYFKTGQSPALTTKVLHAILEGISWDKEYLEKRQKELGDLMFENWELNISNNQ